MAYDVQPSKGYNPGENAFSITLQGDDPDEIKAQWDGLADGATILIPWPLHRSHLCTACLPTITAPPGSSASKLPRRADTP
jgi:hypothetical protein